MDVIRFYLKGVNLQGTGDGSHGSQPTELPIMSDSGEEFTTRLVGPGGFLMQKV